MVPMPTASINETINTQQHVMAAVQGERNTSKGGIFSLHDSTSLVTGGARGIGLTMAAALLEAGSHVVCLDLLEEPVDAPEYIALRSRAKELKLTVGYFQADITDADAINSIVDQIGQEAKDADRPLKSVIHGAAVQKQGPVLDFDPKFFDWVMRINVTGTFIVTQAAARAMKKYETGGSIILMASISGFISNRGLLGTAYNSSKAAVHQLCRCAAVELAEYGIRVNTISPGYIATDMTKQLLVGKTELMKQWTGDNPMNRMGEPSEFKGAAVYLASEASSFMTGSDLRIDGGHCCW
ncbi:NAD(P)-binding protein [Testicularia cyperi]|uniref:NAD(P)-binding protein n=1 Tax=Testicularia cyperi TaxID=1882483 RepID=A0A317XEF4_9BASI|nr:NAD(P)-binding protein [Testicularia cyperi]